jgi:hypothetical protein
LLNRDSLSRRRLDGNVPNAAILDTQDDGAVSQDREMNPIAGLGPCCPHLRNH